jgi:predicted nucleic-acid-binding protein
LLESAWVLEGAYRFPRAQVVAALRAIAGLPGVTLTNAAAMHTALNWADEGMDFADAMHLALTTECDAFVTFDRNLTKWPSASTWQMSVSLRRSVLPAGRGNI